MPCDALMEVIDARLEANPPTNIRGKSKHSWPDEQVHDWLAKACADDLISEKQRWCLQSRTERTASSSAGTCTRCCVSAGRRRSRSRSRTGPSPSPSDVGTEGGCR